MDDQRRKQILHCQSMINDIRAVILKHVRQGASSKAALEALTGSTVRLARDMKLDEGDFLAFAQAGYRMIDSITLSGLSFED